MPERPEAPSQGQPLPYQSPCSKVSPVSVHRVLYSVNRFLPLMTSKLGEIILFVVEIVNMIIDFFQKILNQDGTLSSYVL